MPGKLHIARAGVIGSLTTRNPSEYRLGLLASDASRATCERCIALEQRYMEDVEYHRTQERLQHEEDSRDGE